MIRADRWILVNKKTRKPSGLRFSYPDAGTARAFASDDEEPTPVEVVGRSGPFSDFCRRADEDTETDAEPSTGQHTGDD